MAARTTFFFFFFREGSIEDTERVIRAAPIPSGLLENIITVLKLATHIMAGTQSL